MSLLAWVLLERFVQADVAIRMAVSAGGPPVTALALIALVLTLTILMAYTFRALLCALVALVVRTNAPEADDQPRPGSLFLVWSAPSGGTGPRAPGRRSCRLRSLPAAA